MNIETLVEAKSSQPVDASERILLYDVLRGFSLGGVFFSNVHVWFSGRALLPPDRLSEVMASPTNTAIDNFQRFFVGGKFIAIFSFLFGLGIAMQIDRSEERSESPGRHYTRRASGMLGLAAVHVFGLWYGDILHIYALLGFILLFLFHRSNKTLLVFGSLLSLFGVTFVSLAKAIGTTYIPLHETQTAAVRSAQLAQFDAATLSAFAFGSYASVIKSNALYYWEHFVNIAAIGFFLEVLGKLLLGLLAARTKLLEDFATHQRLIRRLCVVGAVSGVVAGSIAFYLRVHAPQPASVITARILPFAKPILWNLNTLGFAIFYVTAIAILFEKERWRRLFSHLAPMGRMALTNYLSQSVIAIFVFYGVGLGYIGHPNGFLTFLLPLFVFFMQIAWSHVWLRFFRFGPVEWVWRCMTYGKLQPMRLGRREESMAK